MSRALPARRYQGAYLIGFLVLSVAAMRVILFYQGRSRLVAVSLLAIYGLLYTVEPLLSARVRWFRLLYFPLQTGLVLALANLRPISDFANALYIPLSAQALHALPRRAALA